MSQRETTGETVKQACSRPLTFGALVLTFVTCGLLADVVHLKNGNQIQGEILRDDGANIVIRFPGGTLRLRRRDILKVERQQRSDYLVEEGEKQLRRGSHDAAIDSFEAALREDPGAPRVAALLYSAKKAKLSSLFRSGQFAESKAQAERLLQANPEDDEVKDHVQLVERTLKEASEEEARARVDLGAGAFDQAIQRLHHLYDRFPDRRDRVGEMLGRALMGKAHQLFRDKEWDAAAERYYAAVRASPSMLVDAQARYVISRTITLRHAAEANDLERLEDLALQGLEIAPGDDVLRYYYGLALEGKGEPGDAAAEYAAILARPPRRGDDPAKLRKQVEAKLAGSPNRRDSKPSTRSSAISGLVAFDSPRFTVSATTPALATELSAASEQHYRTIFRRLGCVDHPRSRIQVIAYRDRRRYAAATRYGAWSAGTHQLKRHVLRALSEHRILCHQDQDDLLTGVLPHEIAHVLLPHRLNYPDAIPLWANEGFAVVMQPTFYHSRFRQLLRHQIKAQGLIPFEDLLTKSTYPARSLRLFYAQSYSLVEFLIRLKGLDRFLEFTRSVSKEDATLEEALEKSFRIAGIAALQNRWIAWFEHQYGREAL